VLIDRQSLKDSRGWIVLSLLTLIVCTGWYFIYAATAPQGPSGGSVPGLVFGGIGTAIILFAWGLTVRRRWRSRRWGKAYTWVQGHIYLSLVSYWVILYHAGFEWGGPLTQALMWSFTICYFSGIVVLVFQQVLPKFLLAEVPLETIYEQIGSVSRQNLEAADTLVAANVVVAVTVPDLDDDDFERRGPVRPPTPGADLKAFYDHRVRPFLADGVQPAGRGQYAAVFATWGSAARGVILPRSRPAAPATSEFNDLRRKLPEGLHGVVDALEGFAEERRQFTLQKRVHHLLHGWLLVHVPASWVMIVLLPLHAVMALRY
jgi:hypothetical protein